MGSATTSFASTHSVSLRTCSSPRQLSSPLLSQLNPTALSFPCHLQTGRGSLKSRSTSSLPLRVVCMRESRASTVTQDSWEKLILKSDAPVLVEFYASWCGPCRMVHRIMDEIAGEYAGRLKCFVLNTDADLPVAEDYEIKAVPVVFLFKNGEKRESVVGTMPKEFYIAAIERVLGS